MSDPDAERMVAASRRRAAARVPHLRQLGEVLDAAQAFEISVGIVLAKCLGCGLPAAEVVAARQNMATTLDIIAAITDLAPELRPGVDVAKVDEWLPLARAASTARNRVVHALWMFDDAGARSGLERRKWRNVPSNEIANALKLLEQATSSAWAFLR